MKAHVPTVLVVQSDYTLRRAIESVLASSGNYKVVATSNPDVAYDLLSSDAPDAVLLDLDLPTMSGAALYLAMIHLRPELQGRIAILTNDVEAEHLRRWLDVNSCPVLRKPFPFDVVASWLRTAMRAKDQQATG
jgi:DNA-binding NarL/FixJ family response regulator